MTSKKIVQKTLALALAVIMTVGLLPTQASAASTDFADVPPNHWAYADVMWARSHGVVDGVGNNRFAPDDDVSHAQMIKMLCDAFLPTEYAAYETANAQELGRTFPEGKTWYNYKAYFMLTTDKMLSNMGLVINNYNSMNSAMNRTNMAQIIANVLRHKGMTATDAQKNDAKSQISDFATITNTTSQDAVLTCYALGILNGTNGQFLGNNSMTRAQACAVIHRMDNLLNGSTTTNPAPAVTPESTPSNPVTPPTGIKDIAGTKYETAIATLYAGGIITDADLTNGCFRPDDVLLTGESALMHIRMFSNVPLVPKSEWPSFITVAGVDYTDKLNTPEGLTAYSLSEYITGHKGGLNELSKGVPIRTMRMRVKNMTYYTTNTAANSLWKPAYHGYGQALTEEYGECGAFDTNLDQTRMADRNMTTYITRGEWAQIMYNLGVTQAGQLTAPKNHGGAYT